MLAMWIVLTACHIFERKYFKKMNAEERKAKLIELELNEINDIRNMITLCHNCHNNFDDQLIGLDENLKFHITPAVKSKIANFYTLDRYEAFIDKTVVFKYNFNAVSMKAISDRWNNYYLPTQCLVVNGATAPIAPVEMELGELQAKFNFLSFDEIQEYDRFLLSKPTNSSPIGKWTNKFLLQYMKDNGLKSKGRFF